MHPETSFHRVSRLTLLPLLLLLASSRDAKSFRPPSISISTPIQSHLSSTKNTPIRGSHYGTSNNSTIPTSSQSAFAVGVTPPLDVSRSTWKRAWNIGRASLPALHFFDKCHPVDSSWSLSCLWWKALAGLDRKSPVFDNGMAYDLLPRFTRNVIGLGATRRFYPRLHHANVEIRTAYLDKVVGDAVALAREGQRGVNVRLVCIGAGYDLRSVRFKSKGFVEDIWELDLKEVVLIKEKMIRRRLLPRRRRRGEPLTEEDLPNWRGVDLNEVGHVKSVLRDIVQNDVKHLWHTIFVFEGVMIYLNESVPSKLLEICADVLKEKDLRGHVCFADRLENIPGGDQILAEAELVRNGWMLLDWLPKPGLARHMGFGEVRGEEN